MPPTPPPRVKDMIAANPRHQPPLQNLSPPPDTKIRTPPCVPFSDGSLFRRRVRIQPASNLLDNGRRPQTQQLQHDWHEPAR